jgi:hypothetical protein
VDTIRFNSRLPVSNDIDCDNCNKPINMGGTVYVSVDMLTRSTTIRHAPECPKEK